MSQLVSQREVADLPLLGRNPYALVQLVPGAFVPATFNNVPVDIISTTNFSVNGARGYQNEFLLDGVPNTSPGNDGPVVYPVVDSVEQYRVTTSNYSAEYGRAAGGVFNVATKSGTNEFHGAAYDYLRNNALDANDFFSNRAGLAIAPFRFNQFGGAFGGPIQKDKTFFFGAYEGVRETQGVTYSGTVPTVLEREGDFSQTFNAQGKLIQIFNPFSTQPNPANPSQFVRSAFSGNKIPASMIDAVAGKLVQFFPMPNTPGNAVTNVGNFTSANPQQIRKDDFSVRVDHEVSAKQRLFGEFFYDRSPWVRPSAYGDPGSPSFGPQVFQRRAAVLSDAYDFNPTTIATFSYGFNRLTNVRYPFSNGFDLTSVGFPAGFASQIQAKSIPSMNISGFGGNFSVANTGDNAVALGNTSLIVFGIDSHTWEGAITKIAGRHTLEFGGQFRLMRQNALQAPDNNGFTFTPAFTQGPNPTAGSSTSGFTLASFLLGTAASGSIVTPAALALQTTYSAAYAQDDFKVTPKLTLNLGLRYEYESPWTERFNRLTNFDFEAVPPLKVSGLSL
ncbi:MAG: TonB-dependent receptor domain-containing protein, partial [Terriglobia bacterium]